MADLNALEDMTTSALDLLFELNELNPSQFPSRPLIEVALPLGSFESFIENDSQYQLYDYTATPSEEGLDTIQEEALLSPLNRLFRTSDSLVLPADTELWFVITSEDVIHS